MSFWGGFVEGFATTAKEEIDKDVARTDKIVDDTVKIGVSTALETREEIKKDKKKIKDELEMLIGVGFSLPKAASIAKAGLSSTMAKLALDTDYKGKADQLWDGTTKFAQDNKLTDTDVVNKLSYQQPLDYGNLKVGATQNSLLGALGLAPKIDDRIQQGITTRVGKLDTVVDRDDISILPGSIPLEARKQFDTTKTKSIDQRILELEEKKITPEGLTNNEELLLDRLKRIKAPDFGKQFVIQQENKGASVMPSLDELKKLKQEADNGNVKSRNLLKGYLENYSNQVTKKQYDDLIKKLR
ncbi:MAG: hypothetical protein CML81_00105 [Rhodobiaceae bacterium]|nr:hypothetical protein [Rhodobiaceae bacterium]RPF98080.1 MAG: hypothetical protein CBD87_000100 [Rhizobiales bacterium TMED227]